MVMVRSWESLLRGTVIGVAGATVAGTADACDDVVDGGVAWPGVAGAVCAGRLVCGGWTVGLGPKYFAHTRITTMESSDAAMMRSSGVNLSFCGGKLKKAPHGSWKRARYIVPLQLPIL